MNIYSIQGNACYSAVSAAIKFLRDMPASARIQLRKIILRENPWQGAVMGHYHNRDFAPYLRENRNLRVERHIYLSIAELTVSECDDTHAKTGAEAYAEWMRTGRRPARHDRCRIYNWMGEAFAAQALMPKGSFTTVLHETPENRLTMWKELKRSAAEQCALWEYCRRNQHNSPNWSVVFHDWYNYWVKIKDMPKAIEDMIRGETYLRIDVEKGSLWDLEEELRKVGACI
jgi:hypothetical protein